MSTTTLILELAALYLGIGVAFAIIVLHLYKRKTQSKELDAATYMALLWPLCIIWYILRACIKWIIKA